MSHDQSFLDPKAHAYVEGLFRPPYAVMERMEREIAMEGQPAVGRSTGAVLRALALASGGSRILEVGTNVGYSALWLASELRPHGHLDTIEIDPGIARRARANFDEAKVGGRITVHEGAALDVLPRLQGPYDMVFLDAVKAEYPRYLDHALRALRPGGILAADNAFWLGRAWGKPAQDDADTRGVQELTRRVTGDPRLAAAMVPSEDGLLVAVLR
jgi:predicted O-methyltransferase YrrM